MAECDKPYHIRLFEMLRSYLRRDLTVSIGIPNPVAGKILKWFDPAHPEYLNRVDAWQKCLCANSLIGHSELFEYDLSDNPIAVRAVQQIAKLVYKWHGDPIKETDWAEVSSRLSHPLPIRLTDAEIAGIRESLERIRPTDFNQTIGRFGPGATSEGFNAKDKWLMKGLCPDIPASFYRVNPRQPWCPTGLNLFRCTKMAEVPKSIKSNRIVSSEPAMSMFAQLAVNDDLVDQIHRLFAGHVSLDNQAKHNRLLYRNGMATLDLSDASDHISAELVERVLPSLWPVLARVRSEFAMLPNGDIIPLRLHAPMGAGTCFSVMTTVILGIISYAFRSLHFSWRSEPWSVYGDDIIVPIWIVDYIIDLLERAGLVINIGKSCTTGHYVESCGLELYHGYDVTPVYLKDPVHQLEAAKLESIAQKWADFMPATLRCLLDNSVPVKGYRYNSDIQQLELLVRTSSARSKVSVLDGYHGLNRWFCTRSLQEQVWRGDQPHALPTGVKLEVWTKLAWRYRSSENFPNLSLWFATRA
jgi:hypothetical protein